jgi:hypothetical protein
MEAAEGCFLRKAHVYQLHPLPHLRAANCSSCRLKWLIKQV